MFHPSNTASLRSKETESHRNSPEQKNTAATADLLASYVVLVAAAEAVPVAGPTYGAAVVVGAVVEPVEASSTAVAVVLVGTAVVVVAAASEPLVLVPCRFLVASSCERKPN